jgi:UDPglucose 6-dehydrogenase
MKEKIVNIEITEYDGDVFNLEVEPFHDIKDDQFYIDSDTGIVVHNCHPRDNIALRWMANKYDLGYDLFDSIMLAREKQALNIAKKLVDLSNIHNLPIVILGKSYKPGVDYVEGSTTILTSYYVIEMGKDVDFDIIDKQAIYLLGHRGEFHDIDFPKNSVILDVWREYKNNNLNVIYYGG